SSFEHPANKMATAIIKQEFLTFYSKNNPLSNNKGYFTIITKNSYLMVKIQLKKQTVIGLLF
ncbi:hypothetical protein V7159_24765, partial [Priestia megaterium]|uniref:hypothetical protein n=1 Tax=Priestia megaterium TaxID=1404 RepID=UPI00300AA294